MSFPVHFFLMKCPQKGADSAYFYQSKSAGAEFIQKTYKGTHTTNTRKRLTQEAQLLPPGSFSFAARELEHRNVVLAHHRENFTSRWRQRLPRVQVAHLALLARRELELRPRRGGVFPDYLGPIRSMRSSIWIRLMI